MACRSCAHAGLEPVLSLGRTPLANALLDAPDAPSPAYPLDLVWCPSCTLLQIAETVPPEAMFRDYLYFSSYSDTMLAHARSLAEELVRERRLGPTSLVVEAASNDGYLLQYFRQAGVPVLGVEPAANVARAAEAKGVRTVVEFFNERTARGLDRADVFLANNVLAHVPDINGFVAGIRAVLKPDGIAVIETPYAKALVERGEFDTIYHEHVFYYSLTALEALFARHGLGIRAVRHVPIHGGSLRLTVGHGPGRVAPDEPWARDRVFYASLAGRVAAIRAGLLALLDGKDAAGYGAAAKGVMLLNAFGIRSLRYVVDRNPAKQGKFIPGVRLPVVPPERLAEDVPPYCLVLVWNLLDEVVAQQAEYRRRGGRFLVPLPEPRVA